MISEVFEKDDDSNWYIGFIGTCSNWATDKKQKNDSS